MFFINDNTTFKQFFRIRRTAHDCGEVVFSSKELMVLQISYMAKVYIESANNNGCNNENNNNNNNNSSINIINNGFKGNQKKVLIISFQILMSDSVQNSLT
ncbi:hypothetical protein H8356DRAFT_1342397 [Neocallimastix lanati (nom. inval.)]|nr:hypothetical protein H8356DRAFT_1342397 [Neocallimastix sp. JGI-2020a]